MVDYSRADGSRNHKSSFDKAANNIIKYVEDLQKSYNSIWEELEKYRKERAAIIENMIQILKNVKIKTNSPLGRCNNEEINTELNRIINELPFAEKEEIQLSLVKTNNRYAEIVRLGAKLDEIAEELAKLHIAEKDVDEEVVITMPQAKDDDLKQVTKIKKAPKTLIVKLEDRLNSNKKTDDNTEVPADDDLLTPLKEAAKEFGSDEEGMENYLNDMQELLGTKPEEEYIDYKMTRGMTLVELAETVYEDSSLWEALYEYGNNKGVLDRKAAEYGLTKEEAATDPRCLEGVTLQIPLELTTYVERPLRKTA